MAVSISTNCESNKTLAGLITTTTVVEEDGKEVENGIEEIRFDVDSINPDTCVELRYTRVIFLYPNSISIFL